MSPQIDLSVTCTVCPLQIEGTVAGLKLSYRARHYRWRIWLDDESHEHANSAGDRDGHCTGAQEMSLAFAMEKIFSIPEVRNAVMEADFAEQNAMEAAAWTA